MLLNIDCESAWVSFSPSLGMSSVLWLLFVQGTLLPSPLATHLDRADMKKGISISVFPLCCLLVPPHLGQNMILPKNSFLLLYLLAGCCSSTVRCFFTTGNDVWMLLPMMIIEEINGRARSTESEKTPSRKIVKQLIEFYPPPRRSLRHMVFFVLVPEIRGTGRKDPKSGGIFPLPFGRLNFKIMSFSHIFGGI